MKSTKIWQEARKNLHAGVKGLTKFTYGLQDADIICHCIVIKIWVDFLAKKIHFDFRLFKGISRFESMLSQIAIEIAYIPLFTTVRGC